MFVLLAIAQYTVQSPLVASAVLKLLLGMLKMKRVEKYLMTPATPSYRMNKKRVHWKAKFKRGLAVKELKRSRPRRGQTHRLQWCIKR